MEQNDKLILKDFLVSTVPEDFNATPNRILMVDAIIGLVDKVYHGEKLARSEVQLYDLDKESKQELGNILSNHLDNLQFYYLLKLVILILYKYSYWFSNWISVGYILPLQAICPTPQQEMLRLNGLQKDDYRYEYGGTLIKVGKNMLDISNTTFLHLHLWFTGKAHIPLGTILAGIIGGF